LLGVWNWRGTNEHGGKVALPDWESIALNDRVVYIAFDSDVMTKPPVAQALERLKAFLESRRSHVQLVYLPAGPEGEKVGLDDYLAAGHSVDDLFALATDETATAESADEQSPVESKGPDRRS
jgi:putative DNA primase/helicase